MGWQSWDGELYWLSKLVHYIMVCTQVSSINALLTFTPVESFLSSPSGGQYLPCLPIYIVHKMSGNV